MKIKNTILLGCLFVLVACAQQTEKPLPDLSFSRIEAQPIYVAQYIVNPLPPHMAAKLPEGFITDPAKNVEDYFNRRYRTAGAQGEFAIEITGVSVQHSVENSDNAVGAFLDVAKKDKYMTTVTLRLIARDVGEYETQKVDIRARQSVTISEHVSLAERERLQIESVNDLINQLDQEVQKSLKETFRISGNLF